MTAGPGAVQLALPERLRQLRGGLRPGRPNPQRYVAEALGTSIALVSSWESLSSPVVPPEDRLKQYAHFLATARSIDEDDHGRLVDELTDEEENRRRHLIDELIRLREEALAVEVSPHRETGSLGGRFWYFPDGQPVTIIPTKLSRQALTSASARTVGATPNDPAAHEPIPYADPHHPNHVRSMLDGDRDATIDLYGHIRAENPGNDVQFLTVDRARRRELTGHVVILGQSESFGPGRSSETALDWFLKRLELPWRTRLPPGGDDEYDTEFVVTLGQDGIPEYYPPGDPPAREEIHRPVFLRDSSLPGRPRQLVGGYPQLEYDIAMVARRPNQLNLSATVTICCGVFSRGTLGAVRAFTDPILRTRNEQWLWEHVDPDDFWMLLQVPVFPNPDGAETVTPDLARPFHRLRVVDRRRVPPS